MNTVILNGVKSTTIDGLLIQSLPPISKPLLRNTVEEIDGRDGDIVTVLGYSAYDKSMSIGLHGKYDIDEVIEFFDSEGTVIFGNEPDKYYKYQIIDQIDFERLLRFRTATVTLHVQPFKYSTVEKTVSVSNGGKVRNSGNIKSKPVFTIYGTGTVNLSINGSQILVINLGSSADHITIDAEEMNAYTDDVLRNRSVVGDYDYMSLKPGANTISWTGDVTSLQIERHSRWR